MINALRKELSIDIISKMEISDVNENIIGIQEIISENYIDLLPEGSDYCQYCYSEPGYDLITEILRDLVDKKASLNNKYVK